MVKNERKVASMKQPNTENIRNILERIWSGELEHRQEAYICGTAACLAGWDVKLNSGLPIDEDTGSMVRAWFKEHNNLTEGETSLFTHPDATKNLHLAVLTALESGRRFYGIIYDIYPKHLYHSNETTVYTLSLELEEFLQPQPESGIRVVLGVG